MESFRKRSTSDQDFSCNIERDDYIGIFPFTNKGSRAMEYELRTLGN